MFTSVWACWAAVGLLGCRGNGTPGGESSGALEISSGADEDGTEYADYAEPESRGLEGKTEPGILAETGDAGPGVQESGYNPGDSEEGGGLKERMVLPERYDYREIGRMPTVGNQGEYGTCWAFSSLMAMETTLLPQERWEFSPDHMSRRNSFSLKQEDGGQYAMSMAYLLAWQGPVTEEEDPYGDGWSPEDLAPVKHVQEIRLLPSKDYQRVKEAIYQIGGVQSSLYTRLQNSDSTDPYYNEETLSYYYPGGEKANHNVVIIGWDDHYPKERFYHEPEGDGAFICLNSWGPEFGDQGCFYVSYFDTNIGDVNVLYSGIEAPARYTGIYQTDLCGWIGQIGYGREEAYFTNHYRARREEHLTAVGFYATMPDTSYEVYGEAGVRKAEDLTLEKVLASGKFSDTGFYTVELSEKVKLMEGEDFWVVVKIQTPGAIHPVAIEYQVAEGNGIVDLSDGEGYLSADGKQWVSAESAQECNLCLKAYTED